MAYCFYNGVKLPELPSTTLANYPYCWIRKNDNTQHYDLIFTKVLGYYDATAGGIVYGANEGTAEIVHYRVAYPGNADDWTNYQTTNTWMALDVNRTVMWSNHYIPNGSPTATVMYFDAHEAIPEAAAYQIERATLVGIADQVRRVCDLETDLTPAEMEQNLRELNVDLMETFVMSGPVEQVIYPDNGCCGFSKVTVGAVSGGWGDDYGGPVEDNTWGDEYTDTDVPTGNLDYSGGMDDNPSYIPEIPGEGDYKVLFSKKLSAGKLLQYTWIRLHHYGGVTTPLETTVYDVKTDKDAYLYATLCTYGEDGLSISVFVCSSESFSCQVKKSTETEWKNANGYSFHTDYGYFIRLSGVLDSVHNFEILGGYPVEVQGIPFYDLGHCPSDNTNDVAIFCSSPMSNFATGDGDDLYVAFGSKTPILYDGSVINNADGSPMTIYNIEAGKETEWVATGQTDGGNVSVGTYTFVWTSHDLKDLDNQNVTQGQSGDPIPEMSNHIPVERNGTYSVDGNTMNGLVGAAQKVTGSTTPLSPTEATAVLDDYMSNPAEEMKW